MSSINVLHEFDSKLYADCVIWCPIKSYEHILVCTTYQLTSLGNKVGSILLFETNLEHLLNFKQIIVNLPGILDAKWRPKVVNDQIGFVTVDSEGDITIYSMLTPQIYLLRISRLKVFPHLSPSPLALYVDWSANNVNKLLVSSSNGYISLLNCENSSLLLEQQWEGHSFEAWIVAFDENQPNIMYSGGDDSIMKCYDTRTNPAILAWKSSTAHSTGVTSFLTSTAHPEHFSSGSYDEYLKLWDTRMVPKCTLSEINLGGGVWRLKYSNYNKSVIAACMFGGFKLLSWEHNEFSLLDSYRDNEECLAYGVDWCQKNNKFASCSFYDHKLTICETVVN